jgi:hypothetical protein
MKRRIIGSMLLSALLGACAAPALWTKPGVTAEEWRTDQYSCERDARMSVLLFGGGIVGAIEAQRFYDKCLYARGYAKMP